MKKPMRIFLSLLSMLPFISNAQDKIWYFGNQAGIDFNSTTPVALTDGMTGTLDYSATVSDPAGNLLFYTDGMQVWNKNHSIMANGTGLMGFISNGQCAVIVQRPGTEIYYIFTVGQYNSSSGLRFHMVDISQNGGLGAVISKNNLLLSPSTEKIDAVFDSSTNSYCIITHAWNSNAFYTYRVTPAGLNGTPVVSAIGTVHQGGSQGNYNSMGQLCISPTKNKLVCGIYSSGIFELFDFDITTGVVSNPIPLNGFSNCWGAAFSPDGTKLYVTEWMSTPVMQMDITSGTAASILSTLTTVGYGTGPGGAYQVGYLQLAPDNKIYGAVFDDDYLLVINDPNAPGIACNVVDDGFYLDGKISQAGLCRAISARNVTTDVNQPSNKEWLDIYPNPVIDELLVSINYTLTYDSPFEYAIYNPTGSIIKKGTLFGYERLKMNLAEFQAGIYILKITSENNDFLFYKKLMKL